MNNFKTCCKNYFGTTDLYEILNVTKTASVGEIRRSYYRLSLEIHPDRVEKDKEEATEKFKVLNIAHSILSNEEKRKLYDTSGLIEDADNGWDDYFCNIFSRITVESIDNYKLKYKESDEEVADIKNAYLKCKGDMNKILQYVLFGHPDEEDRYRTILLDLIENKEIPKYDKFIDEPESAKLRRKRKYEQEAKEAAKVQSRSEKTVGENKEDDLMAMIALRQQQRAAASEQFFDRLIAKYGNENSSSKKKSKKSK